MKDSLKKKETNGSTGIVFSDAIKPVEVTKKIVKSRFRGSSKDSIRRDEIISIRDEIHLIITGKASVLEPEQALIVKRQNELINIKKILQE